MPYGHNHFLLETTHFLLTNLLVRIHECRVYMVRKQGSTIKYAVAIQQHNVLRPALVQRRILVSDYSYSNWYRNC